MTRIGKLGRLGIPLGAVLILRAISLAAVPDMPPQQLVRKTVEREIAASQSTSTRHMFVARRQNSHGSLTKLYVETDQAIAGLALANDDKPLTDEQRQAEFQRLDRLAHDPQELARKHARENEDAERIRRIVRALPDAFLFEYDGTETGRPGIGNPGDELVRLKFRPNPKYDPPTHVEQVLVGMEGTMLVDARQYRIARIDGILTKDVGFGWGILGHLDKGGRFLVEQQDLGDGTWDARRMILRFTGKVLVFKRLDIQSDELYSDYRRVSSGLTFAQGVDLLKKEYGALATTSPSAFAGGISTAAKAKQ